MERPAFTRDRAVRSILVLFSLATAAMAVWVSSGMADTALAFAVGVAAVGVAVALATTGAYGVVVHHLGAVALVDDLSLVGVVLLEVAAVILLVSDTPLGGRLKTGLLLVPTTLLLGIGAVVLAETSGMVIASVAVLCVLGICVYGFHRLTIVRLGLAATEGEA